MSNNSQLLKSRLMTKKLLKLPYEAPDFYVRMMGVRSVICQASLWETGDIPDEDYNSFDVE
jgi:hypothetical protein